MITITNIRRSTCMDPASRAIDADVTVDGMAGEITLVPSEQDRQHWVPWGPSADYWVSGRLLQHLTDEQLQDLASEARSLNWRTCQAAVEG